MGDDARPLPKQLRVSAFCGRARRLSQSVPQHSLPRLSASLAGDDGVLSVELQGRQDARGAGWVKGGVEGRLPLRCERCLEVFDWPLALTFDARVVQGEQEEARLIGEADTWMADEDELALAEAVEDEIMLALPLAAYCDKPGCSGDSREF